MRVLRFKKEVDTDIFEDSAREYIHIYIYIYDQGMYIKYYIKCINKLKIYYIIYVYNYIYTFRGRVKLILILSPLCDEKNLCMTKWGKGGSFLSFLVWLLVMKSKSSTIDES